MAVEPVHGEPAAIADLDGERALVVADYHAGLELGLRREGVELESRADRRREHLLALLERTAPDRLVLLGDLGHDIGDPWEPERTEIATLLEAVTGRVPVTLVKGNHDGDIETLAADLGLDIEITPSHGQRLGPVGFAHGHTWPSPAVVEAPVVCVGHEHPVARLEDEVGGYRLERVWLRGAIAAAPFSEYHDRSIEATGELLVFPAFNDLSGGTWVNVRGQGFLAPFLPAGLADGEAWLLDGTRLGPYASL